MRATWLRFLTLRDRFAMCEFGAGTRSRQTGNAISEILKREPVLSEPLAISGIIRNFCNQLLSFSNHSQFLAGMSEQRENQR